MTTTAELAESKEPMDVRRLVVPIGVLFAILGVAYAGGMEMRSIKLAVEMNAQDSAELKSMLERRPTSEGMEAAILQALRPIDSRMAEVQAELRALTSRIERVERNSERDNK